MYLGLDIGTSKMAAALVDAGGAVQAVASRPHRAGDAEQDVALLERAAWRCVRALTAELRAGVRGLALTGQMHGVLPLDAAGRPLGPLITWQDGRCDADFLARLEALTGHRLRSGYGCATLAWLRMHDMLPDSVAAAGTIHDYLTMRLCGERRPCTDPTDAASYGLFDLQARCWDRAAAERLGVDALLPEVRPSGSPAGALASKSAARLGLPSGIPVTVAIGDNQASLLATLRDPERELALTLGTGGQLSAVLPAGARPVASEGWEVRPYLGERDLAVGASLCGGAAWRWLADAVRAWLRDLGRACPADDRLYARLNALGLAAAEALPVHPHFLGERHDPSLRGGIEGITLENFTLGPLARGLARGIMAHLRGLLPPELLAGRTRLAGSGNALRRNPLLRAMAEEVFGLPLVMTEAREEAAVGAARLALRATGAVRQPGA